MHQQQPSLGRIVVFEPANGGDECAAIVTGILPDAVHLYVMPALATPRMEAAVPEGTGPRTWKWPPRVW